MSGLPNAAAAAAEETEEKQEDEEGSGGRGRYVLHLTYAFSLLDRSGIRRTLAVLIQKQFQRGWELRGCPVRVSCSHQHCLCILGRRASSRRFFYGLKLVRVISNQSHPSTYTVLIYTPPKKKQLQNMSRKRFFVVSQLPHNC